MTTYVSRPTRIEAVQWTGDLTDNILFAFLRGHATYGWSPQGELMVRAGKDGAQGMVPVPVGHWIVRRPGDDSDHWPVDPDYFEQKYMLAAEGSA